MAGPVAGPGRIGRRGTGRRAAASAAAELPAVLVSFCFVFHVLIPVLKGTNSFISTGTHQGTAGVYVCESVIAAAAPCRTAAGCDRVFGFDPRAEQADLASPYSVWPGPVLATIASHRA